MPRVSGDRAEWGAPCLPEQRSRCSPARPLPCPALHQTPGGCVGHLNGRMESRLEEILPEDSDTQGEGRAG